MCLIAFAIDADPACPLLIAANRDEFFDRPTAPLHRWAEPAAPGVVAGRDLRDGGTWLGVSEAGRVAMLTNVRSARPGPGARSRGELALSWLGGELSVDALARELDPAAYGGFNLVVGDVPRRDWAWLGNRNPDHPHDDTAVALHRRRLGPGVYGVSNATLDTPWPKTQRLKSALQRSLARMQAQADEGWLPLLTETLADDSGSPGHELPETGVPRSWEQALSSPFVKMAEHGYGTRSSLVMQVRQGAEDQQVALHEWTHTPLGWNADGHLRHHLRW